MRAIIRFFLLVIIIPLGCTPAPVHDEYAVVGYVIDTTDTLRVVQGSITAHMYMKCVSVKDTTVTFRGHPVQAKARFLRGTYFKEKGNAICGTVLVNGKVYAMSPSDFVESGAWPEYGNWYENEIVVLTRDTP